jgi:Asp-tRNA(Asn)/Glu-tRNA(Gln) amidotransferase A subunit family amidase
VGIKPTRGRISSGPINGEGWAGLSTDGILARTVADAAAGLEAIAGHLPGDPFWADDYVDRPRPLRVAFTDTCAAGVDPEVAAAVRETARLLESLGHDVREAAPDLSAVREPMGVIVTSGMASLPIPDRSLLDPLNQAAALAGEQWTGGDYVRAVDTIRRASRQVVAFWDDVDILLTPTLTRPAPRIGTMGAVLESAMQEYMDWLSFTQPFNCTGQPAISLPLAMTRSGLPIGIQLVGPPRGEKLLFAMALELEQVRPWAGRRPDLAT